MSDQSAVTMVEKAIHNPGEPRHFMRVKPVGRHIRVLYDRMLLVDSKRALQVFEIGRDVYHPVFYFLPEDIEVTLARADRLTHCPLKGDAIYFDWVDHEGQVLVDEIAWSYATPLDFASDIAGYIAFYTQNLIIEDSPL